MFFRAYIKDSINIVKGAKPIESEPDIGGKKKIIGFAKVEDDQYWLNLDNGSGVRVQFDKEGKKTVSFLNPNDETKKDAGIILIIFSDAEEERKSVEDILKMKLEVKVEKKPEVVVDVVKPEKVKKEKVKK